MNQKHFSKSKKTAAVLLSVVVVLVAVSALFPPASSKSTNPCAECHPQYAEYLDILEGSSQNQLPATIEVGGTKNVTVVMENIANIPKNTVLSSVSMTLRSQNGHFSVKTATNTLPGLGLLQWGTTTAVSQSPVPELPTSTGLTILLFATALVAVLFVKMSPRQR